MALNRHGLARDIPDPVKRAVRQRDGFGCVICGNALIEYDHLEPPFADATEHLVDGIVTLCVAHHARKTRGLLSNETIRVAKAAPKAKQNGFSFDHFDTGAGMPRVSVGRVEARNTPCIIRCFGETVLGVREPEEAGGPYRLNARIKDNEGSDVLHILDNEWRTPDSNWDVELVGKRLKIRCAPRQISLVIRSELPGHLIVEQIDMRYRDARIVGDERRIDFYLGDGTRMVLGGALIEDSACAVDFRQNAIALSVGGGSMQIL